MVTLTGFYSLLAAAVCTLPHWLTGLGPELNPLLPESCAAEGRSVLIPRVTFLKLSVKLLPLLIHFVARLQQEAGR